MAVWVMWRWWFWWWRRRPTKSHGFHFVYFVQFHSHRSLCFIWLLVLFLLLAVSLLSVLCCCCWLLLLLVYISFLNLLFSQQINFIFQRQKVFFRLFHFFPLCCLPIAVHFSSLANFFLRSSVAAVSVSSVAHSSLWILCCCSAFVSVMQRVILIVNFRLLSNVIWPYTNSQ